MQIRRQLRARRLAEKQAQMRAALAEKVARDVQESAEKERKVELREEYKQRMAAWRQVRPTSSFTPPPRARSLLCGKLLRCTKWICQGGSEHAVAWYTRGNTVEHRKYAPVMLFVW